MRLARKLIIGLMAAGAVMAFAGTSSAMAGNTALCELHEQPCAAANTYQGHFEALAANPKFLTDITNISCKKGRILGFALGLANPQATHLEAFTFTEDCLAEGAVPCVVESTELGLLLILRTELNLWIATTDNTRVLISCPGAALHCVFDMAAEMHVTGSPNANSLAEIHALELELELGEGMFCPEETFFDALYKVVEPDPIAITG